jgi:hypothetical protein
MEGFNEKYNDLIKDGYEVSFHMEEKDFPMTGKYTAYCILVKKDGKKVFNDTSRVSYEEALYNAHTIINLLKKVS